jgi:hypothetical protein
MAAQNSDHDKARELAEKALDKLVEGDEAAGDKLIQQGLLATFGDDGPDVWPRSP